EISKIKEKKYVVKDGDNLWVIARRFNTSVRDLKEINDLNSNHLDIGDVLFIGENNKNEPNSSEVLEEQRNKEIVNKLGKDVLAKKEGVGSEQTFMPRQTEEQSKYPKRVDERNELPKKVKGEIDRKNVVIHHKKPELKKMSSAKVQSVFSYPDTTSLYSFVSSYVKAYKNRDLKSLEALFEHDAKENGIEISKILPSYGKNFSSLEIVKYDFFIDGVYLKDQMAYMNGDFELTFKNRNDRKVKSSKGRLNWVLSWQDNNWKIKELNYSINETNLEAENL
ncbi:MAG: LysM peptidoglycan-binding domain-containing protein, partial [Thermodesulfobacteriota bacterium]